MHCLVSLRFADGAHRKVSRVGVLDEMASDTIAHCEKADDPLQKFQRSVNGYDQCFVGATGSDDFEERLLGGDTLRLLEEGEGQSINVFNNFLSTFGSFVFLEFQDVVCFSDNLS